MGVTSVQITEIRDAAARLAGLAESVTEAHELGIRPGTHDQPWTIDFQRQAVAVYRQSLPPKYLERLGVSMLRVANEMELVGIRPSVAEDWSIVRRYFRSTGEAVQQSGEDTTTETEPGVDLATPTPSVLRFDLIAEIVSPQGTKRLGFAASTVAAECAQDANPLDTEEIEWLGLLAQGLRTIDIAEQAGMSERTLQRRLGDINKRLGANTRTAAVATAIRRGWLTPALSASNRHQSQ